MAMTLASGAFDHQGAIPKRFTCDGEDVSPDLAWSNLPDGTRSLALIIDDPDAPDPAAPQMVFVHWVLYNIPPELPGLPDGINAETLPSGAAEGINDFQRVGYGGPCPPSGRHRYFHKLYALDRVLPDLSEPCKEELLKAMEGHILEQTELVGTYQR